MYDDEKAEEKKESFALRSNGEAVVMVRLVTDDPKKHAEFGKVELTSDDDDVTVEANPNNKPTEPQSFTVKSKEITEDKEVALHLEAEVKKLGESEQISRDLICQLTAPRGVTVAISVTVVK